MREKGIVFEKRGVGDRIRLLFVVPDQPKQGGVLAAEAVVEGRFTSLTQPKARYGSCKICTMQCVNMPSR